MKRLFKYFNTVKKELILIPILIIIEVLFEILIPVFMSKLIDEGINATNEFGVVIPNKELIFTYGGLMIISAIIALFFGILVTKTAAKASTEIGHNLRQAQFEKIQTYSFENIDNFKTSSLITRMTMDVNMIQQTLNMTLRVALRSPALIVFSVLSIALFASNLAAIFVLVIPILIIGFYFILTRAHKYFVQMFDRLDNLNLTIQEDLIAIRTVKSFVREDYESKRFEKATLNVKDVSIRAEKIIIFNRPLMQFSIGLSFILIGFFGSRMISVGGLTEGQFANTITYVNQVLFSLMMISQIFLMFAMSRASIDRINEVLNEKPYLNNPENPIYEIEDGSFKFENVSFKYGKDNKKHVLQDVNLEVKSGSFIGIFGSTGTGKSTLVQLLARLYDVTEGSIYVSNKNIKSYDLDTLRQEVILVLQKNVLFSGTVKENIKWGKKDATDDEVISALKKAQAYDFVSHMDKGLDSYIEQGGINLSGGQRQRLTIARALIANPKILILDDSTSAVDTKTDALINDALDKETPDMTKVVISQRLSSIEHADMIILMDDKGINSIGTHNELLEKNEMYRSIYKAQMESKAVDQ
ncbi:ABC transporter ATP-binding protein [Acholeplasma granularum]|uniref:ABC transporter ATP-binding protein n=1 Tax=Acholeplasma granularum TaxID=264635 RepID=UPI0004BBC163|nr:ABC transporter ATP-binding protein [Acholeplasma granularum]